MATGFSGREVLIKLGDGEASETFTTIAALRDTTITFNEQTVDTTSKDDSGARSLLSGSIVKSMTVSGSGVFTDVAAMQTLATQLQAGTHSNYEIDLVGTSATTGGAVYTAAFRITQLEYSGSYDGEAQYSLTLESDGAITTS
jgi:TP901-1 family phage major tail protein